VLSDRRNPADALVVGESFVFGRDQADDVGFATLAHDFESKVPIEKVVAVRISRVPCDVNRR